MFPWSRPKCPVEPDVKAWIEERMNWLVGQFGWDKFAELEIILPIEEHFPLAYDGSPEAVRELFEQVSEYMEIDPETVELEFYSEGRDHVGAPTPVSEGGHGTAGMYDHQQERTTVWLETSNLDDPTCVVAVCAHELCHVHLLGGKRLSPQEPDHEAVTDLAAICFGMGIFVANASLRDHTRRSGNWNYWNISRQGYLTDPIIAYALALYASAREERKPKWTRYLRADIRSLFQQGLAYLQTANEKVIVPPEAGRQTAVGPYPPELIEKLYWKRAAKSPQAWDEAEATHDAAHSRTDKVYTQAVFFMEQELFGKAIALFTDLLCADPMDGDAYQQRATAYLEMGAARESLADAEKAVECLPDDSESYRIRGEAHLELRQYDLAIADFARFIQEEDHTGANAMTLASVYHLRGEAHSRLNDLSRSAADFSRAIRLYPQWPEAYWSRAGVYERLGEFDKARADREEADRLAEP